MKTTISIKVNGATASEMVLALRNPQVASFIVENGTQIGSGARGCACMLLVLRTVVSL